MFDIKQTNNKFYVHQCQAQKTFTWLSPEHLTFPRSPDPFLTLKEDLKLHLNFTLSSPDIHLAFKFYFNQWQCQAQIEIWRSPDVFVWWWLVGVQTHYRP